MKTKHAAERSPTRLRTLIRHSPGAAAVVALAGVFSFDAFANGPQGPDPQGGTETVCACVVDFQTTVGILGSQECEHGPEHDMPDCAPGPNGVYPCSENGNGPSGPANNPPQNDGVCHCFLCGLAPGCEGYQLRYTADCPGSYQEGGECETHFSTATGVVSITFPTALPADQTCSGADGGVETRERCHDRNAWTGACLANNCTPDMMSPDARTGPLPACGPPPSPGPGPGPGPVNPVPVQP